MRRARAAPWRAERHGEASSFSQGSSGEYVGYGKSGRYYCQGANVNHGTERCISFGSTKADEAVGTEVMRVLNPLGTDAAIKALEAQTSEMSAARRQLELSLTEARYQAAHARRQYDAVDPAN